MPTPAEARQTAVTSATQNAELQVAIQLKSNWRQIQLAASQLVPPRLLPDAPSDADFNRMALEMIDQRQLTITGTDGQPQVVSLTDLDQAADMDPEHGLGFVRSSLNLTSFQRMVPTRRQIGLIADAVGNGVRQNTGSIGFLGGATFGSAIAGFFSWLMSGFEGGFQGLMDKIAGNTATSMRGSVRNNLQGLRHRLLGTEDDISAFLTPEGIQMVGDSVYYTVLNTANPNAPRPQGYVAPATLAATPIGTLSPELQTQVRLQTAGFIRDNIILGFSRHELLGTVVAPDGTMRTGNTGSALLNTAYNSTTQNWASSTVAWLNGTVGTNISAPPPSAQQAYDSAIAVANGVSTRLSVVLTDPSYRYPPTNRPGYTPPPELAALAAQIPPLSLAQMSEADRAAVLAEEARLTIMDLANAAPAGSTQKTLYEQMAVSLPAEMRTSLVVPANAQRIALVIGNAQNPNTATFSTAAQSGMLTLLTGKTIAERTTFLANTLNLGMPAGSPARQQLQSAVGGTITNAHLNSIAARLAPAIDEINARTAAGTIPASGPERYAAVTAYLTEQLQDEGFRNSLNGITLTPEIAAILGDQMTLQILGTPSDYATNAGYQPFRDRFSAIAGSVINGQVQTALRSHGTELSQLAGGELQNEHYTAIAGYVSPILAGYATNPQSLAALGDGAYATISQDIFNELKRNQQELNAAGLPANETLLNFSDDMLRSMADDIAANAIPGIIRADAAANAQRQPPLTMPPLTPPASFTNAAAERRSVLVATLIEASLTPEMRASLQQAAGATAENPTPITAAHFTSLSQASARGLQNFLAAPVPQGGFTAAQYTQYSNDVLAALNAPDSGLPESMNPALRQYMADMIVMQAIQKRDPEREIPEAFQIAMQQHMVPVLAPQLLSRITPAMQTSLQQAAGATAENPTPITAANFTSISEAAAKGLASLFINPVPEGSPPTGGYNVMFYRHYSSAVLEQLNAEGSGAPADPALRQYMADMIAAQAIQARQGPGGPPIPALFQADMQTHMTPVLAPQLLARMQPMQAALQQAAATPQNQTPITPDNFTSISQAGARALAPLFSGPVPQGGYTAEHYTQYSTAILAQLNAPETGLPASINPALRQYIADTMAAQAIQARQGEGGPAIPAAFNTVMQQHMVPVLAPQLLSRLTPEMRTALQDASATPGNATPITPANFTSISEASARGLAPLFTNAVPQGGYTAANYTEYAAAVLAQLNAPETALPASISPQVRTHMANVIAAQAIQARQGAGGPAIPAAFVTQMRTSTENIAAARIAAAMSVTETHNGAAVPVLLNAMTLANHNGTGFASVNPTTVSTSAVAVLRNHMFTGNSADLAPRPNTIVGQNQLVATIQTQLAASLGGPPNNLQPRLRTQLAHAMAVEFVRNMPAPNGTPQIPAEPLTPTQIITNAVSGNIEGARAGVRTSLTTAGTAALNASIGNNPLNGPAVSLGVNAITGDDLLNLTNASSTISGEMLAQIRTPGWATMTPVQRDTALNNGLNAALLRDYSSIFPGGLNINVGTPATTIGGGTVLNPVYAAWAAIPFNPLPRPAMWTTLPSVTTPGVTLYSGFLDLTPNASKPIIVTPVSNYIINQIRGASQQTSSLGLNQNGGQLAMMGGNNADLGDLVPNLPQQRQPNNNNRGPFGNGGGFGVA